MQVGWVSGQTAGADGQESSPRLLRAAHEFEGQMMKELMEPMVRGNALTGSDDDPDAGSGEALGEFAAEALGRALSERGGLGIGDRIVRQLAPAGNRHESREVTGGLHQDTVMKTLE